MDFCLQISMAVKYSLIDYIEIANDKERRQKFIKNSVDFVRTNGFSGLDLFWVFSNHGLVCLFLSDDRCCKKKLIQQLFLDFFL